MGGLSVLIEKVWRVPYSANSSATSQGGRTNAIWWGFMDQQEREAWALLWYLVFLPLKNKPTNKRWKPFRILFMSYLQQMLQGQQHSVGRTLALTLYYPLLHDTFPQNLASWNHKHYFSFCGLETQVWLSWLPLAQGGSLVKTGDWRDGARQWLKEVCSQAHSSRAPHGSGVGLIPGCVTQGRVRHTLDERHPRQSHILLQPSQSDISSLLSSSLW